MKKFLVIFFVLVLALGGAAMAEGLPKDDPVIYGRPDMDESSVAALPEEKPDGTKETPGEVAAPELDKGAVAEGTPFEPPQQAGSPVRPGDKPRTNSITIKTVADITFASPYTPAQVDATNPEGSTVITQYLLRISIAELERQTGRTGYTEEQVNTLKAQGRFDPETSYIALAETKGVAPGAMVQTMMLNALPDGSTLSAGDYAADMVVAAYDVKTNKRSLVGTVVKVKFHILSDEMAVTFNAQGLGELYAFNPGTAKGDVIFGIQLSQQALVDGCGDAHRTPEESALQQANPDFDPEYEFITLYESQAVSPGSSLEGSVQLLPLPDGQTLPAGTYVAWLARYSYDQQLEMWKFLDARTQLNLIVTPESGHAGA